MPRLPGTAPDPRRTDLLVAALLTVATQVEVWTNDGVSEPFRVQVASFALITVATAWRRSAPLAAIVAMSAGFAVQVAAAGDAPVVGGLVALLLMTYSLGAHATRRQLVLGVLAIVLGVIVAAFADADKRGLADALGNAVILGVVIALGRLVRRRQHETEVLDVEVREQRRRAAEVLQEERARIARELHDVVAHNVSLMVLQAGAARQVLDSDPARVREPLLTIESTGRQAIAEMQRLLGILRRPDDADAQAPQPGLARLGELVADTRRAGLPVRVHVSGQRRELPAGVDLAVFRIVQEALTNALRHAGPAAADVCVRYGAGDVEVEVRDDGRGPNGARDGTGHGLVGMRERVALYGGELEARGRPEGGFLVRARLPVQVEA